MNRPRRITQVSILLACLLGCRHAGQTAAEKEHEPDVRVRVQPAERRTIAEKVSGLGRCEAIPDRFAVLTAAAEGRVVHLPKQPGAEVKAGEAVVELDTTIAARNLTEKEAARDFQKVSLRATIDQAQLAVDKARAAAEHLRPLRKRGEVSETILYEAELALRQATLQLTTAQSQYDVLVAPPQAVAEGKVRIDPAQAAVDTAKAQLELLTIRSPIAGVLNSLNCQLGQTLSVGTAVGDVVDSGRLNVVVWLSVADARRVKTGQTAQICVCDAADKTKCETTGAVKVIGKMVDPQTGNLPVRILVENAGGTLTLGQAVSATIVVRQEKVLAVPVEGVHNLGEGPVISVVRGGKSAILHDPKLGMKDEHWVAVSGTDLEPGEAVIKEGGYNLPDGTEVLAEKAEQPKPEEGEEAE